MKIRKRNLKLAVIVLLAIYCLALFFVLRTFRISRAGRLLDIRLDEVDQTKRQVLENALQDQENYREMVSRMASLTIFFLQHDGEEKVTPGTLQKLKEAFAAEDVFQIDLQGNVLQATSSDYTEDFTEDSFAILREVSEGKPVSEQIWWDPEAQIKNEDETAKAKAKEQSTLDLSEYLCYQSAKDGEGGAIVLKKNWRNLRDYEKESSSWEAVLSRENLGGNGLFIAVAEDGTCIYDPLEENRNAAQSAGDGSEKGGSFGGMSGSGQGAEDMEGGVRESGTDAGKSASEPSGKNQKEGWSAEYMADHNGLQYGRVPLEDNAHGMYTLDGQKYICAVRKSQNDGVFLIAAVPYNRSAIRFRLMILLPVILILTLTTLRYAMALIDHENEDGVWKSRESRFYRRLLYMLLLNLAVSAVICVYTEQLYFYAAQARSNEAEIKVISSVLDDIDKTQENGRKMYQAYIRTLTDTAAALIAENPEIANTRELRELASFLGVEHILVYNRSGKVTASDRNYSGLRISKDPEDLSSEFQWLLYGEPLVVQDDVNTDFLNEPLIYAGSVIQDGAYGYNGFVQIAYRSDLRDRLVHSMEVRELVSTFRGDNESFAFAVGKENGRIYAEDDRYHMDSAEKAGLTERELCDGFAGFFYLEGRRFFGTCEEGKLLYVFIACDVSSVLVNRMGNAMPAFLCTAAMLVAVFTLFLVYGRKTEGQLRYYYSGSGITWSVYLTRCVFLFSAAVTAAMILKAYLFPDGSLWYYVVIFPWPKGMDILSFTMGMIEVFCAFFFVKCVLGILNWLENVLPFLQQTMIRMLRSFLRYLFLVGSIFLIADRMGASARSLLASAGILTLVISLAAQSIIADIFAGLSIIFERTFKVGDVIKVNTSRGKVIEIGIRNTRMIDLEDNNIKIVNNSSIKAITNYSEIPVFCNVEVSVTYEDDLSRTEALLDAELPRIKRQIAGINGEIHYNGAERFTGKNAVLRFQAVCDAQEYESVRRCLERSLIVLLRSNGIQTDVHTSK